MRLDAITVALRPRPAWEAADLGMALVRRHAASLWPAWVLASLPVFALTNVVTVLLGVPWLALLLMWWLKPAFDRIPLFVVSRAVFGAAPATRETLAAFWRHDWRVMLPWLTWRRLHPARATLMPIDLLERLGGARRRDRVRVIARERGANSVLLTLVCANVEAMLSISILTVGLLFVPVEFFSESAKALWETLFDEPPAWAQVVVNLVAWIAVSIVEPFYVGAGFGLYLNRRTQLECWDIELAFRRIAARLASGAAGLAIACGLLFATAPAHAQVNDGSAVEPGTKSVAEAKSLDPKRSKALAALFGEHYRDGGEAFERAVAKAYEQPDLADRETVYEWQPRRPDGDVDAEPIGPFAEFVGAIIAGLAKYGLWILAAFALLLIARSWRSWWPKLAGAFGRAPANEPPQLVDIASPETLPADPLAAARAMWDAGNARGALGLVYRAAVAVLARRLDTVLPPGATEAECLQRARAVPAYTALFTRVVAQWRAAAYAERLPAREDFDALLRDCGPAFGGTS